MKKISFYLIIILMLNLKGNIQAHAVNYIDNTTISHNQNSYLQKNELERKQKYNYVNIDGVRLRDAPNDTTSHILELMYSGEQVTIYDNSNSQWLKVKREKTGTVGWVYRQYIN